MARPSGKRARSPSRRSRSLAPLAAAAALLVVGCVAPEAPQASRRDRLDARWLRDPGAVHGSDLALLAELGRRDPEVTALFAEAIRGLGGSFDAVAAHMSICPPSTTQEGGLTRVEGYNLIVGRPVEEVVAGAASPSAEAALQGLKLRARTSRRFDGPDSVRFEIIALPKICFLEGLTIGAAYETVIHELVHALRYDPYEVRAIATSAPDEPTFLRRVALAHGGEVDAYELATRARLRLPGGHDLSPLRTVLDFLGPTPLPRETLAEAIVAPPPRGLGYADGLLRGKYRDIIAKERETLSEERALEDKLLGQRRELVAYLAKRDEVDRHNLKICEHNAAVAQARSDAVLLAEARRRRAEAEASIAKTAVMTEAANASIARLTAQMAEVERRLAALPSAGP